jgi:hypothetical protein
VYSSFSPASSDSSTEDDGDDTDTASQQDRGRRYSPNEKRTILRESLKKRIVPPKQRPNGQNNNSNSGKSERSSPGITARGRESFTRSQSPVILPPVDVSSVSVPCRQPSPSVFARCRQALHDRGILPATLRFQTFIPLACTGLAFHIDTRKAGESLLLLGSLIYASAKLSQNTEVWISIGPPYFIIISECEAY